MENKNHSNSSIKITDKIKRTCEYIHKISENVKINEEKIKEFVESFGKYSPPSWTSCHFNPNDYDLELSLAFTFVIDSLNFCFWPYEKYSDKDFEYDNLVQNLFSILKTNPEFFTPSKLSNLTCEEVTTLIFNGDSNFPLLDERTRSLNELGDYIQTKCSSSFLNFIEKNDKNCVNIVKSIAEGVTTFRDETVYKGKQIFIYKRAQILSADLYYMLKELNTPIILSDAQELTMFADYRVPQILIEVGVLEYNQKLHQKILNKEELLPNSQEEIEIRANTIISVEKIKNEFNKKSNNNIFSLEVDYILWNIGEEKRKSLIPHHRTLSIFY